MVLKSEASGGNRTPILREETLKKTLVKLIANQRESVIFLCEFVFRFS